VKVKSRERMGALLVMAAALVLAATVTGSASARRQQVVIGWAFRQQGQHGPVRRSRAGRSAVPREAGQRARRRAAQDHHPATRRTTIRPRPSPALSACSARAPTSSSQTCDVDLATPVVQEAINKGVLAIAPCIGTDQMGPKRFGAKGALAFSYGNVAQDEGSHGAGAWGKGWKTAARRPTPTSSTSRTSCRRSRPASSSSAARSSATRPTRPGPTTSSRPSAASTTTRPTST